MPGIVTPDRYADQIPRFTLPAELTNKPPVAETPATPPATPVATPPVTPAAPPKEEAKPPSTEAVETPPAEAEPGKETTEKDPEKTSQRRFERRIDKAHRRAAEAQARAEALERELAEIRQKTTPPATGAPKMEDFTDIGEFQKAVEKHARDSAIREYEEKQRSEAQKAMETQLLSGWETKANKAALKYDDWDEVVGELKPTTAWSVAIMQAENGDEVAYYLGSHPKEAQRIIGLDPYSQIREIGKLEAELARTPEKPKIPSKAPPPITPVTGEAAPVAPSVSEPMPFEQYQKVGRKMFRGR